MVEGPQMPAEPLLGTNNPTSKTRSRRRSNHESGTALDVQPAGLCLRSTGGKLVRSRALGACKKLPAT